MTEAQFWSFLRSNIRLISRKWAPRKQVLIAARRPNESDNARLKWEYQCAACRSWFPGSQVEVDHIVPCGTLKSFEDLRGFAERLFVEPEGMEVLCESCHQTKTNQTRNKPGVNNGQ